MLGKFCFIVFIFCLLWYLKLQPPWSQKSSYLSCITGHALFSQLNISLWLEFTSGICELNGWVSPSPLDWCTIVKVWPLPAEYPFHSSIKIIQSQNCNEVSQTCLCANYKVLSCTGKQGRNSLPITHDISGAFLSQSDLTCPTNLLGSSGSVHHTILYFSTNMYWRRSM